MRILAAVVALLTAAVVGAGSAPNGAAAQPVAAEQAAAQWAMGGYDLFNTRFNPVEDTISTANVGGLTTAWTVTTQGDVSATPAVVDGAVYYPDWGGYFSKVDASTGEVIWSRLVADYVGIEGAVSRSSPAVVGDTVYIGTQTGARLLAVDTATGDLRWSTAMDDHQYAILTQSPVVHDGVVYQGVSSSEEVAAIDSEYPCCSFRGSLVAVDAATGEILWKTYTIPEMGTEDDGFSGAAVWSGTPVIDAETNTVYITTGNDYTVPQEVEDCQAAGGTPGECLPPWNRYNSFIAMDLDTGEVKWSTGMDRFDHWNGGCIPGIPPPNNCPDNPGPDWDFADGAHLMTIPGPDGAPRKVVGAGQKSGEYWLLDAATGEIIWSAAVGPGSEVGGIQWGTATDGQRIYFTESNFRGAEHQLPSGEVITYSSFGALDPATGRVIWQVPEPHEGLAQAAVTVANGVVYTSSLNGYMYAWDAATGELLWEFLGEGSSNAGPAIVDGTVYWGNGYARAGIGTASTTFYAFRPAQPAG